MSANLLTTDKEKRLYLLAVRDAAFVSGKDKEYGSSWRKRGGVGAFFVSARKWDRLEERLKTTITNSAGAVVAEAYDIFNHVANDPREEGLIDDIRDLRQYLLLIEEHLISIGVIPDVVQEPEGEEDLNRKEIPQRLRKKRRSESSSLNSDEVDRGVGDRINHPRPFGYDGEDEDEDEEF